MIMYDSTNVANLPAAADAYAGYVDGRFATYAEVKAKFPRAHVLSIAVFAVHDADACDIENGDLTPEEAPGWVRRQLARGAWRPVVYASASVMPGVLAHLHAAGIGRSQVRTWSAHYDSPAGEHICGPWSCGFPGLPDCDGTQWTDKAHGIELDQSLLLPGFFPPAAPVRHLLAAGEVLAEVAAGRHTTTGHLLDVTRKALTEADINQGRIYYTSR